MSNLQTNLHRKLDLQKRVDYTDEDNDADGFLRHCGISV